MLKKSEQSSVGIQVAQDIVCFRTLIVNVVFVGETDAASGEWVLVDAGIPFSTKLILQATDRVYS